MRRVAFVLGGANTLDADYSAALDLCAPDTIIAANHAARDFDGSLDHFVTLHTEKIEGWIEERRAKGLPDAATHWTSNTKQLPKSIQFNRVQSWDGSSGLLGVTVALHLGYDRIILCGCPLSKDAGHYDDPAPWMDAPRYRAAWTRHLPEMKGKVKSFSGWTNLILGAPTQEWLQCESAK